MDFERLGRPSQINQLSGTHFLLARKSSQSRSSVCLWTAKRLRARSLTRCWARLTKGTWATDMPSTSGRQPKIVVAQVPRAKREGAVMSSDGRWAGALRAGRQLANDLARSVPVHGPPCVLPTSAPSQCHGIALRRQIPCPDRQTRSCRYKYRRLCTANARRTPKELWTSNVDRDPSRSRTTRSVTCDARIPSPQRGRRSSENSGLNPDISC